MPRQLVKKGFQGRENCIRRQFRSIFFGDDIDIPIAIASEIAASKKFTYKPFDPVSLDSSADFAGYRYAQPGPSRLSRKYSYDKYIILKSVAVFG
jgi:hypothetical protein